nr:unnamed protein product [Digitaria exilis]
MVVLPHQRARKETHADKAIGMEMEGRSAKEAAEELEPGGGCWAEGAATAGEQGNVKPMIEEAVESLLDGATADLVADAFRIADLGCSSGPNALVLVSTAVDAVRRRCLQLQQPPPELCLHLNDLPGNDFNSVIKSLATYREAQEVISLVITSVFLAHFTGGSSVNGLIDKEKLDSFYIPSFGPSEKELREIIEAEASFAIVKMVVHEPTICVGKDATTPYTRARGFRAVMEPMILQHFGSSAAEVMDEFVTIAERLVKMSALDEYPNKPRAFVAASLVRRT